VGIASSVLIQDASQINGGTLDGFDLDTTVPLKRNATRPVTVSFSLDIAADACEAAVYKADTTLTELVSVDTIRDPALGAGRVTVTFDPSPFLPTDLGTQRDYIIRLTCRRGYLSSALLAGHVDAVSYPVRTSTNWTAAFHTMAVP